MRSQCHRQRKSLTVQLNSRPMRRTELYTKVCPDFSGPVYNDDLLRFGTLYYGPLNGNCPSHVNSIKKLFCFTYCHLYSMCLKKWCVALVNMFHL